MPETKYNLIKKVILESYTSPAIWRSRLYSVFQIISLFYSISDFFSFWERRFNRPITVPNLLRLDNVSCEAGAVNPKELLKVFINTQGLSSTKIMQIRSKDPWCHTPQLCTCPNSQRMVAYFTNLCACIQGFQTPLTGTIKLEPFLQFLRSLTFCHWVGGMIVLSDW